jgi:hypothetical protein
MITLACAPLPYHHGAHTLAGGVFSMVLRGEVQVRQSESHRCVDDTGRGGRPGVEAGEQLALPTMVPSPIRGCLRARATRCEKTSLHRAT